MIGKALGFVSALPGPWKWAAYIGAGAVALTVLLAVKGAYDGYIEHKHAVKVAEELNGVSADTLIEDLRRNHEQAEAQREELARHREEEDARARMLDAKEAALEQAMASFEQRQRRALGEYTRRLGEIRPRVDAIPEAELYTVEDGRLIPGPEWRAAVAALEGGR